MISRITYILLSSILIAVTANAVETVVRGPYLQQGGPNQMTVRWRTETPSIGTVWYGKSAAKLNKSVSELKPTIDHEIILDRLKPSTQYLYEVGNQDEGKATDSTPLFFNTSPRHGKEQPTRVWVIGDSGTSNDDAKAVYEAYQKYAGDRYTDLWLMLGDNAYNTGTDKEYQKAVFDIYPDLLARSPLWSTIGNHDAHSVDAATQTGIYYDIFTLPKNGEIGGEPSGTEAYYSFDYGNSHFLCLASISVDRSLREPAGEPNTTLMYLGLQLVL